MENIRDKKNKTTNGAEALNKLMPDFTKIKRTTKHKHEYQEVCEDLQKDFGKLVWTLPYKKGFTEHKIRTAGQIARSRGITTVPYLVGIIKKL